MHRKTFLICSLTLLPVVVATPLILTSCGGKYISKHFSYNDVPYANDPLPPNEEFNKLTTSDKINYLNKNINETIYFDDFLYTFVLWFDNSVSLKSDHLKIKDYVGNITASYNNGYGGIDLRFEFKDKKISQFYFLTVILQKNIQKLIALIYELNRNLILLKLVTTKLIQTFILCKHEIPVDTSCLRFTMRKPITNIQVMWIWLIISKCRN